MGSSMSFNASAEILLVYDLVTEAMVRGGCSKISSSFKPLDNVSFCLHPARTKDRKKKDSQEYFLMIDNLGMFG